MMGTAHTHTVTFTCARKYVRRRRDETASAQATAQRYWITLPKPMKQESGDQHDTKHAEGSVSLRKHTRSEKHTFLSAVIKTEHSVQPKHRTQDRHVSFTMSSETNLAPSFVFTHDACLDACIGLTQHGNTYYDVTSVDHAREANGLPCSAFCAPKIIVDEPPNSSLETRPSAASTPRAHAP